MSVTATPVLRHPTADDGRGVQALIEATGVLDVNSTYAVVMTLQHFTATSVVAVEDGAVVGFVTAYRLPERPEVLFVWQVGVDASQRGRGLATRMLRWLLQAPANDAVRFLETTVTPSNAPSRALFRGLARRTEADCSVGSGFTAEQLGAGHEPEERFRIGPFPPSS